MMHRFLHIKYENILAFMYIPYLIINLCKANEDMIILALLMHLTMLIGLYYVIKTMRKETLQELRNGTYESFILEDIIEIINNIKSALKTINKLINEIYKELGGNVWIKNQITDQTKN